MRTTLDIDDDVLAAVKELGRQQGRSAGQMVSTLLRQALTGAETAAAPARRRARSVGGFRPFGSRGTAVGNQVIDALRDAEGI